MHFPTVEKMIYPLKIMASTSFALFLVIFDVILEKLNAGWEQIRAMVGDEAQSGISDLDIKETLYHYYFDVQASLNWLYGEEIWSTGAIQLMMSLPSLRGTAEARGRERT